MCLIKGKDEVRFMELQLLRMNETLEGGNELGHYKKLKYI